MCAFVILWFAIRACHSFLSFSRTFPCYLLHSVSLFGTPILLCHNKYLNLIFIKLNKERIKKKRWQRTNKMFSYTILFKFAIRAIGHTASNGWQEVEAWWERRESMVRETCVCSMHFYRIGMDDVLLAHTHTPKQSKAKKTNQHQIKCVWQLYCPIYID